MEPDSPLCILPSALGYQIGLGIFSGVSCSGERMAEFGDKLCVRWDLPGFAPHRCGCGLPGGIQCPVHCGTRAELEPAERARVDWGTGVSRRRSSISSASLSLQPAFRTCWEVRFCLIKPLELRVRGEFYSGMKSNRACLVLTGRSPRRSRCTNRPNGLNTRYFSRGP